MTRVVSAHAMCALVLWVGQYGCGASATTVSDATADGQVAHVEDAAKAQTANGGAQSVSWSDASKVAESGTKLGFTQTYVGGRDDRGNLHVVYWAGSTATHAVLPSSSGTWQAFGMPRGGAGFYSNVSLGLVRGGTFVAHWAEVDANAHVLYASLSSDYGQTWSSPAELGRGAIGWVTSLHTFVGSDGTSGAAVAWNDETDKHVYVRRWRGATMTTADWSTAKQLSNGYAGASLDCAVGGQGDLLAASWEWEETSGKPKKLMFGRSLDGGDTWQDIGTLPASGVDPGSQDASLAVDSEGSLWIAYQGLMKVYAAKSTDQGKTFQAPIELGPGLFVKVASNDRGDLAFAWEYFEEGGAKTNTTKRVGVSLVSSSGKIWSGPFSMPESEAAFGMYYPYVMLSSDRVDVFWLDTNKGNELYYRSGTLLR